jgi:hypothetical protein
MTQRFTSSQMVKIIAMICATVLLMSYVIARAATGTLVNVTDPTNAARKAKVNHGNTLTVESRAGSIANSFNVVGSRLGLGYINLTSTTAPNRIAVTEVTLTGQGPSGQQEALIEAFVRTTGSSGCGGPGTGGYTRHTLRRVAFNNQGTIQVSFDGPPLVLPIGASGQPTCFGITVISIPSGSATYVGGTGYRFAA